MKVLFFILLVSPLILLGDGKLSANLGFCSIDQAFSSFQGTYMLLKDCEGNLGFKSKVVQLIYSTSPIAGFKTSDSDQPLIFKDQVSVILGLEHTVELARLTQRKLRLELDETRQKVLFFSLSEPLSRECSKSPVLSPPPEPTPSPDDFHPVPPPPKRPIASTTLRWKNKTSELNSLALTDAGNLNSGKGVTGNCQVSGVYSGPKGTFVELDDCQGDLGFKSKMMQLHTEKKILIQTGNPSGEIIYTTEKQIVLGMMQTAELAHLFRRRLVIELDSVNGNPKFFALLEAIRSFCP